MARHIDNARQIDNGQHIEEARPFTALETLRSLAVWGSELPFLAACLGGFLLLDRTVMRGERFDELGKWVCRRVTDLAGIRIERHGLEQLDEAQSYIFCINHVSFLDLFVVFQSIPFFHRSFQDESHFKIPVYGGLIRVFGQVPVRRGDKDFNRRAFARATEMLHGGDSFVVFPEGHRTRDGKLGAFFSGGFRLAIEAGVPVVPMALRGLRDVNPAGEWRIRGGRVDVIFGAPIAPRAEHTPESMAAETRDALERLLREGC
ncbi:MAG: 1-acyl-sn-glycerol-3-phosphate acyltransferase [Myxococcales bacterium]|nr:1-acyl-sn-glycerol-3-phosphate acyltransferase [Myxococcales bacterium]